MSILNILGTVVDSTMGRVVGEIGRELGEAELPGDKGSWADHIRLSIYSQRREGV